MKRFYLKLLLIFTVLVTSFSSLAKVSCQAKELKFKNCRILSKSIRVGVSSTKIRFSVGSWSSIGDFPDAEKVSEWQQVRLLLVGERQFLSLKVWHRLEKEVELEELHWVVLELKERKIQLQLDKTMGRRASKGKKIQDVMKPTQLRFENGHYKWSVGEERGEL